jgi:hypothetical protein
MSNPYNTDGLYTFPASNVEIHNCLESIECAIAFDVRDWSSDRRSAWIYGIVFGWDEESFDELSKQYGWDNADKIRLADLHRQWLDFKEAKNEDSN